MNLATTIILLLNAIMLTETSAFFRSKLRLKNVIMNQAFYSSIVEKFPLETLDEAFILQVTTNFDGHNAPTLSMFCLTTILYLGYLLRPKENKEEKLENIEEYVKIKKRIKQLMIFTFALVIRNVETAS